MAKERRKGGNDIQTVQELLGHRDVKTTMIYTNILNRGPVVVRSPLGRDMNRFNEVVLDRSA
jgi:integrase